MATLVQLLRAVRRLGVLAAAGVLLAGATLVAAAPGASAGEATAVDCSTTDLQIAIDNASPGAELAVSGTCFGNFTIDKDLTLLGGENAVLDGQAAATTLTVSSNVTVRLVNLTITDGNASSTTGFFGGGIDNSGTLTLDQSTVSNNVAGDGGGIYNPSGAVLTLRNSTVSGNSGLAFAGGSGGGILNSGTTTLEDSSVTENSAFSGGGGIFNSGSFSIGAPGFAHLTVKDSAISQNTAACCGGGIENFDIATLKDSTISQNTAQFAGGIDNLGGVTLDDTAVSDNTANGSVAVGGGIYSSVLVRPGLQGGVSLNDSTVSGNTANGPVAAGGGIYNALGTVSLNDSAISDNIPDNCDPPGSVAGCTG